MVTQPSKAEAANRDASRSARGSKIVLARERQLRSVFFFVCERRVIFGLPSLYSSGGAANVVKRQLRTGELAFANEAELHRRLRCGLVCTELFSRP